MLSWTKSDYLCTSCVCVCECTLDAVHNLVHHATDDGSPGLLQMCIVYAESIFMYTYYTDIQVLCILVYDTIAPHPNIYDYSSRLLIKWAFHITCARMRTNVRGKYRDISLQCESMRRWRFRRRRPRTYATLRTPRVLPYAIWCSIYIHTNACIVFACVWENGIIQTCALRWTFFAFGTQSVSTHHALTKQLRSTAFTFKRVWRRLVADDALSLAHPHSGRPLCCPAFARTHIHTPTNTHRHILLRSLLIVCRVSVCVRALSLATVFNVSPRNGDVTRLRVCVCACLCACLRYVSNTASSIPY